MNIRDFKYIIAVADYKSFYKAAMHCNVSQPTLSGQIKKLEDEHGVMPGKQIPEIPPEQSNISEVADPEEEKDKLN